MNWDNTKEETVRRVIKTKLYAFHILTTDMLDDLKNIRNDLTEREKAMANLMYKMNEPLGSLCEIVDVLENELSGLRKSYDLIKSELKTFKKVANGTATDLEEESISIVSEHIDDPLKFTAAYESCAKSVSLIPDPLKRDVYATFLSGKFKIKKELVEQSINKYRKKK